MQKLLEFLAPKRILIAVLIAGGYHFFAAYSAGQPAGSRGVVVDTPAESESEVQANVIETVSNAGETASAENAGAVVADQNNQQQNQVDQQQSEAGQPANNASEEGIETAESSDVVVDVAEIFAEFLANNGGNIQDALVEAVQSAPDMYAEFMNLSIDRGLDPILAAELVAQALGEEVVAISTAGIDVEAADPSASVSSFASNTGGAQGATPSIRPSIPPTAPVASASPAR